MEPITPEEKLRTLQRINSCASSLVHDGVLSPYDFKNIMDTALKLYATKEFYQELLERPLCLTQDHPNGEPST